MLYFALISENTVVSIISADSDQIDLSTTMKYQNIIEITNLDPVPEVGWILEGTVLKDPTNSATPSKKMSRLKLLERFTDAELAGIEGFANQSNAYAYALRAAMRKQMAAEFIDLALPQTVAGIHNLVALGLLSSQRASEIINTPLTEAEKYRG